MDNGGSSQLNDTGGENRYRFKSFKQRADEIEINVARRVEKHLDEPEDHGSFFAECLKKQAELNLSRDYTEFHKRMSRFHHSLAQILYHKEEIISAIEEYLSVDRDLVIESMLDLTTSLARDLQEEVLPYFTRLVQKITPLIRADSVAVMEAASNALAYLFKYLSKNLVVDLRPTFDLLAPLMGVEKQRANVRRFAAESLAFLIRKLRGDDLQQFISHTVKQLRECPEQRRQDFLVGIALLYFECMRGVNQQLHSRASSIMGGLVRELYREEPEEVYGVEGSGQGCYELLEKTAKLAMHYTKRETAAPLWSVVLTELDTRMRAIDDSLQKDVALQHRDCRAVAHLTRLLGTMTLVRKGGRVGDYAALFQRCQRVFELSPAISSQHAEMSDFLAQVRTRWLSALLMQCDVSEMVSLGRVLLDRAVAHEPLERVLGMATTLARLQWPQWQQIMLPYLVRLTIEHWGNEQRLRLLTFWAEAFQLGLVRPSSGQNGVSAVVTERGQVLFAAKQGAQINVAGELLAWLAEPMALEQLIEQPMALPNYVDMSDSTAAADAGADIAVRSAILSVLARVSTGGSKLLEALDAFAQRLTQAIGELTTRLTEINAEMLDRPEIEGELTAPWSAAADAALGLNSAECGEQLCWGAFHQLSPLVSLLGRTLSLQATAALQASAAQRETGAAILSGAWGRTLKEVAPNHASNAKLVDGLVQVGQALKALGKAEDMLFNSKKQEEVLVLLGDNLRCFQPTLRLRTLQLLELFVPLRMADGAACDMVAEAAALEAVPVTFEAYKDRINHLRRMTALASNTGAPEVYRRVFASLTLAQLGVNFRPLWAEAITQLGQLAQVDPELFWNTVARLLCAYNDERRLIETGATATARAWLARLQSQWDEQTQLGAQTKVDGHALECPNVARFDALSAADYERLCADSPHARLQQLLALASTPDTERVDYGNVQRQVLKLVAKHGTTLAEKHSRAVVRSFLSFVRQGSSWAAALYRRGPLGSAELDASIAEMSSAAHRGLLTGRGSHDADQVLNEWLALFAGMRSPRSLHMWEHLHRLFTQMLGRGDPLVQGRALECLLTWRDPSITPYADQLRGLADARRFRDTMGTFNLAVDGEDINVVHRSVLMPVVFRILHGQTLARGGKASRKDGMRIRRSAILAAMAGVHAEELRSFVAIGLESFATVLAQATPREQLIGPGAQLLSLGDAAESMMDVDGSDTTLLSPMDRVPARAQKSFFKLFYDLLRQLGVKAMPVLPEAMVVLLSSIESAQRAIDAANAEIESITAHTQENNDGDRNIEEASDDEDEDENENDEGNADDEAPEKDLADRASVERRKTVARETRHLALTCLAEIFALQLPGFDFAPYVPTIFRVVIDPRLPTLAVENTQNSSVLLRLLKSWSQAPRYFSYLASHNAETFPKLMGLLVAPKVQPEVVGLALDVLQNLLDYTPESALKSNLVDGEAMAEEMGRLAKGMVQDNLSLILSNMRTCFATAMAIGVTSKATSTSAPAGQKTPATIIAQKNAAMVTRQIHILSRVAEYATEQASDAQQLLELLIPILRKPNASVSVRTKGSILTIMLRFIPIVLRPQQQQDAIPLERRVHLLNHYLDVVSQSFGRLPLESVRLILAQILDTLAQIQQELLYPGATEMTPLQKTADLIKGFNAVSRERLGGPDFERRLEAFAALNERMWCRPEDIDAGAWVPLLHNLAFFARDTEEMSIRTNAAFGISRFITRVAQAHAKDPQSDEARALGNSMSNILLPTIRYAFTSKTEVIRQEFLSILHKAVRECGPYFDQLRDLTVLDSADDESNIFNNLMHIQVHRRMRALRRFRNIAVKKADVTAPSRVAAKASDMDVDAGSASDSEESSSSSDDDDNDDENGNNAQGSKQASVSANRSALAPLMLDAKTKPIAMISQSNVRNLFMPLLEHWALAEPGNSEVGHELIGESITTIGVLGAILPWSQYNSSLRKYLNMMKTPEMEKRLIRLTIALLDSFHYDLREVQVDGSGRLLSAASLAKPPVEDDANNNDGADENNDDDDEDDDSRMDDGLTREQLDNERIHESLVRYLLPELKKKISETNEDNLVLRAPLTMAVVRILTALPASTMNLQLPGILTTICNMLRAKAQSARNATRDTLIRIAKFLGPAYFGFIVRELDASLARGAQRHVLGYTIYTLLKEVSRITKSGELDYTLELLVELVMQDLFGHVGEEKNAAEWTNKSKEASVHHGPDCLEILASICSFDKLRLLLTPLRDILQETETPKRTKMVEQALRKISIGLNRNTAYNTPEVLTFSHGIINQYMALSAKSSKDTDHLKALAELKRHRLRPTGEEEVTVYMKRSDVGAKRDYLQANAHIFVQFSLEIIYYGLKRRRFDTEDAKVLGMLDPFVDLAGNGLYSKYNSIITLSCKIWAILVSLPLPSISPGIPIVIKRLFAIFQKSSTTNSDMIQNCFKLLASLLRSKAAEELMSGYDPTQNVDPEESAKKNDKQDKKGKKGKKDNKEKKNTVTKSLLTEQQLCDLIDFIRPDIEEPERQATAFNLIRAVLTRRMIVDSLYTLLDTIRGLMITAQAENLRELCRLTWFQFLMDYPIGERRLTNAMGFIVQNASGYVFESGRTSALEIMGIIIKRFADEILLPKAAEPFFLGLVLIIAKDDSSKCREMAAQLLPDLVKRFDQPRLKRVWILLDQWSAGIEQSAKSLDTTAEGEKATREAVVRQTKQRELGRAALQCYGLIAEPLGDRFHDRVSAFLGTVDTALAVSLRTWKQAEEKLNLSGSAEQDLEQLAAGLHIGDDPEEAALAYWETAYIALNTFAKFAKISEKNCFGTHGQAPIWLLAAKHLVHPHPWVRLAASRLLGTYFASADPEWMLQAEPSSGEKAKEGRSWEVAAEYAGGEVKYVLMSVYQLRGLVSSLVVQLSSRGLSPELGNQVVKNLYFIAKCFLITAPKDTDAAAAKRREDADGSDLDREEVSDQDAADAEADADAALDLSDSEDEDEADGNQADADDLENVSEENSLIWLINRISRLARTELIRGRGAVSRRTYSFRLFAAIAALLPPSLLSQSEYIVPILNPLHRTTGDDQLLLSSPPGSSKTPEQLLADLKTLSTEVLNLIQKRVGVTVFTRQLTKVQQSVDKVRSERRARRKLLAMNNPELYAQRKFKKHENSRKRRIEKDNLVAQKRYRNRTIVKRAPKSFRGEAAQ
ncbi:U3 snoRNP protein [Coemansia sp. Benny D115]|nr:U3 snoRNP protein [Coemansia sp. Benny D115]